MPIYSYRCESCGHAKDVLQKVSDPLLTQCPACGADSFRKQLTAAGFQLKGSGWYVTDFKGGAAAAAPKAEGAAAPAPSADPKPADSGSAAASAPAPAPAAAPAAPAVSKPAAAPGSSQ